MTEWSRGPLASTVAWVVSAAIAAAVGWSLGGRALGPLTLPGPTVTVSQVSTRPSVPVQVVPASWSARPSSPHPAGIPEGRHEVARLVLGDYVGIPADTGTPCRWLREGLRGDDGLPSVRDEGSTTSSARVRIGAADQWFTSSGCQWKLLAPRS